MLQAVTTRLIYGELRTISASTYTVHRADHIDSGIQFTDADGVVKFDTIFPGHYVRPLAQYRRCSPLTLPRTAEPLTPTS